jgi:cysteine-S-conjugate beta-lyase
MSDGDGDIATRLIHAGRDPGEQFGFVNTPVYRGSTVLYADVDALRTRSARYTYGRAGTPTMAALQDVIREIDGAAGTILTSSGLSAVTTALFAYVRQGDHILVTDSVYRPTRQFADTVLARLGVETEYYDPLIGAGIARLLRPTTRLVFTEAPGSLTMEMQDIPAIAMAAHAAGALVLTDNTWGASLHFAALAKGADVSIQSATKYIVGHADAMLGAVSANAAAWPDLQQSYTTLGPNPGSEEVYLGLRGIRTLQTRLRQHQNAGIEMAVWLRERPEVADIWKRDFTGACGLFSVILKPCSDAALCAMLNGLKLFGLGFSWGGFESLVVPFDPAPYRTATTWTPKGPALRFHIGLESPADLKAELERGFARLAAAAK